VQPQWLLDKVAAGKWELAKEPLSLDSLGSNSRYKSCKEYVWKPSDRSGEVGEFASWISMDAAHQCLRGRWIVIWGDSTSRIFFSTLVNFLHEGAMNTSWMPTHGFDFGRHRELDNCTRDSHCERHIYVPASNTMISFKFCAEFSYWPELMPWLRKNRQSLAFKKFLDGPILPDVVLFQNGPWERHSWNAAKRGAEEAYRVMLRTWVKRYWGQRSKTNKALRHTSTTLLMLGNTLCERKALDARAQRYHWRDAKGTDIVRQVVVVQKQLLSELGLLGRSARYLDSPPATWKPEHYTCSTHVHLPAVVTDAWVNSALKTVCSPSR